MENKVSTEVSRFELDFFESLVRRNPRFIDAISALAETYTASGSYEKGLEMDEKLALLCPKDGLVFYNLACSYALLNRITEALSALEKAAELGYRDWKYMQRDADLAILAGQPRFAELLQRMRAS
jgi:tetratricopeptide (TPR) repeat protein